MYYPNLRAYHNMNIVVLACSIKHGDCCIAGKEKDSGKWVRIVSNDAGDAVPQDKAYYKNPYGTYKVVPLKIISVKFHRDAGLLHQPENKVFDPTFVWTQNYSIEECDLPKYLDSPADLWGNENRVDAFEIKQRRLTIDQSLYLIHVTNVHLEKDSNTTNVSKRRCCFIYNGVCYNLPVTCLKFDKFIGNKFESGAILCISLGEEYNGFHYKIVAAIYGV